MAKNNKLKTIPFGKPVIDNKEFDIVNKVLRGNILVHGPKSAQFENAFNKFTGSKFSTAVSSCTAGMHLIYFSLGIGNGDEVIVPAQTHVATAHAVELSGAKPVFIDCELDTGNIDINKIEKKINKRTKAIAVVHFLGIPVDMQKIVKLSKKHKLIIIEDCALAVGSKINDKHVGLHGDFGVFSFYPVKHMTTGEGGIIISKSNRYMKKIKLKKAFGVNKTFSERKTPGVYDCVTLGFNYRMSEIHSAIGIEQIKKVPIFLKKRSRNFKALKQKLEKINKIKILDTTKDNLKNSHYCLTFLLSKSVSIYRHQIIKLLNKAGIGTSIYYPQPVPRMSYYKKKYRYNAKEFKNAEIISDNSIALPVGPHITEKNINYIFNQLKNILDKF